MQTGGGFQEEAKCQASGFVGSAKPDELSFGEIEREDLKTSTGISTHAHTTHIYILYDLYLVGVKPPETLYCFTVTLKSFAKCK